MTDRDQVRVEEGETTLSRDFMSKGLPFDAEYDTETDVEYDERDGNAIELLAGDLCDQLFFVCFSPLTFGPDPQLVDDVYEDDDGDDDEGFPSTRMMI